MFQTTLQHLFKWNKNCNKDVTQCNCLHFPNRGCSVKKMFLENSQSSQENTCARASFLIKLQAETVKKMFLEISQNSQENTCARVSFLIKWQAWKETLAQVFSCEFYKSLRTPFLTEHLRWLLLKVLHIFWDHFPAKIVLNRKSYAFTSLLTG